MYKARRFKGRHMKSLIYSFVNKEKDTFQNSINAFELLNTNKRISKLLSSSLTLLEDLQITSFLKENFVIFEINEKEFGFRSPNDAISLFNIVEPMWQEGSKDYELTLPYSKPISDEYVMLDENILKLNDGPLFFLESIGQNVTNKTYFSKKLDNLSLDERIVLNMGAAFEDTAINFFKQGDTILAIELANFEWLVKNLELNKVGTSTIIALYLAAGRDGTVDIESVDTIYFDGEARIYYTNRVHSNFKRTIRELLIKNIIYKERFDSIDYSKTDFKEYESFSSSVDFKVIKSGTVIACWANNLRHIFNVTKSSGFGSKMWHFNNYNHEIKQKWNKSWLEVS